MGNSMECVCVYVYMWYKDHTYIYMLFMMCNIYYSIFYTYTRSKTSELSVHQLPSASQGDLLTLAPTSEPSWAAPLTTMGLSTSANSGAVSETQWTFSARETGEHSLPSQNVFNCPGDVTASIHKPPEVMQKCDLKDELCSCRLASWTACGNAQRQPRPACL